MLPAGRYATVRYTGHPDGMIGAIASLREWASQDCTAALASALTRTLDR